MKKSSFIVCHLSLSVALMVSVALVALTACSSSEDSIAEAPTPSTPDAPKTYTMTVTASKCGDEATTRALTPDGNALNATWAEGEKIKVLKKVMNVDHDIIYKYLGTLSATTANGQTATFTGSLDADKVSSAGDLLEGDKLLLAFPGSTLGSNDDLTFNYTGQDGTLGKIASSYDYCMTPTSGKNNMVSVASVNDGVVTTTGTAPFTNQQAIVRFTLKDASGNAIYPTSLDITVNGLEKTYNPLDEYSPVPSGDQTLTLSLDGSTNVIYAALRGISNKTVKLTATTSKVVYKYTKSGVTFENGKYYTIDVKMGGNLVYLSSLNADYTAQNGDVLTGELPSGIRLSIAAGASVTLNGVTIRDDNKRNYAGITCLGDATINLVGTNSISMISTYPGIQAGGSDTTLTIQGIGSLTVTVENGYSSQGAGIGSGGGGTCGNITISGGTVTASGGNNAAGIGSGGDEGTCGAITINGGTVEARGGINGSGIGSGNGGTFESIKITKDITRVTATMGSDAQAPIGRGNNDQGSGSVEIDGTTSWTAGTATTNLNFSSTNDTWTLTHK